MKVILYIGHHKVGSTALQVFLSHNACALLKAGILYPCVEMQGFSQLLARAIGDGDHNRWILANLREPHSALAYRMMEEVSTRTIPPQFKMLPASGQMLHAIRQQVAYLKPHTMILCSEVFSNFGEVDPQLITRLRTAFPKAELEIYCALRRPDEYLASWHGQRIKVGEKVRALRDDTLSDYLGTIHMDYRKVIAPWVAQLPEAHLHLRNYADIRASGGSPEDFFARTGVTLPENLFAAGRRNPSLPMAAVELKRRANLVLPFLETEKFNQHILQKQRDIEAVPNDQIEMFSPKMRRRLHDAFQPVQTYLSDITTTDAFFPDFDEVAQPRPVPELEATKAYLAKMDPTAMPSEDLKRFVADLQREYGCVTA